MALKLYSDRDPAFQSELFQLLMKEVKKLIISCYNALSNGLTEKGNEFITNYLTAYAVSTGKDWDLSCREAAFAYNSNVCTFVDRFHGGKAYVR